MRARLPSPRGEPAGEGSGQRRRGGQVHPGDMGVARRAAISAAGAYIALGRLMRLLTTTLTAADVLAHSPQGLYCPASDFHIDPTRPVPRAVITHGHSDHARAGHGAVLATQQTLDIMRLRLGENFASMTQALAYGETLRLGGVDVSLHPAGHILGSAQVRIDKGGFRVVVSGDYKRADDPTCAGFELLRCEAFVTEATLACRCSAIPPRNEIARLLASQKLFPDRAHLVGAYSLGKAQRVIRLLRARATTARFTSTGPSRGSRLLCLSGR